MPGKDYRSLVVWKRAMELVEAVYLLTKQLPVDERFGLASQIQRAAISVPSNIAEGNGRMHRAEYIHHLSIARGSLMEVETQLALIARLKFVSRQQVLPIWNICREVGKMLNALISSLRKGT